MRNATLRFPSTDKFEAIEFNADQDAKTGVPVKPMVYLLDSGGSKLGLPLRLDLASFLELATWATEMATLLVPAGTVESYAVATIKPAIEISPVAEAPADDTDGSAA